VLTRSALKARLRRDRLRLSKRLGQNILINTAVRDRIIEAIGLRPDDAVVEIGAGTGALTEKLAGAARPVVAFELDRGLEPILREQLGETATVDVRCQDFLEADLPMLAEQTLPDGSARERLVFVANLPYSITTPVITRVLESGVSFRAAYFTVQREVAQRLLAPAGSRERGAITFLVEYHAEARRLLTLPRAAFEPVPKVESVLVGLFVRPAPPVAPRDPALMFALIRAAFGARRKVLKNALQRLEWRAFSDDKPAAAARLEGVLRQCGLDPMCRAEQLTLQQFADLSDALVRADAAGWTNSDSRT
jgi:16S rRNA (adenine1518-N6/adenine1519-N6)-dimethyltransferase